MFHDDNDNKKWLDLHALLAIIESITGYRPRQSCKNFSARCPAHDDRNPSLSIAEKNGAILMHCFAGCTIDEICQSLNIKTKQLFSNTKGTYRG